MTSMTHLLFDVSVEQDMAVDLGGDRTLDLGLKYIFGESVMFAKRDLECTFNAGDSQRIG